MAKLRQLQAVMSAGELDPQLELRENVEVYYKGVERLRNALPLPQGGGRRRQGLAHRYTLLTRSTAQSLAAATLTAPQGGTAANARDGDEATLVTATANLSSATPFVLLHVDLIGTASIAAVDVLSVRVVDTAPQSVQLQVQRSSDNVSWTNFGAAFTVTETARGYRAGSFDGASVSARYWRVVKTAAGGPAKPAELGEVRLWRLAAGGSLSAAKKIPFAASDEAVYLMELTEHNLRVYKNGVFQADVPVPYGDAQIPDLTWTQSQDTLLLFHPDVRPWRIFRLGSDTAWTSGPAQFVNVAKYDFGDTGGGVNHVFKLVLSANYTTGVSISLELEGETTPDVNYPGSSAATAAALLAALRQLKNLSYDAAAAEPGIVVTAIDSKNYTITLNGQNGKRKWARMSASAIGLNGTATCWAFVETTTEGEPPGEAIMSAARGWPRCGCIYGQRLWLGGFKSLPNAVAYSVAGDYFNMDNRLTRATSAAALSADTDRGVIVRHLVPGRHLLAFTSAAEFFNPSVIIETPKVALNETTKHGAAARVRPIEADGRILFAQANANVVRSLVYSDAEQTYVSANQSLLASHLIDAPVAASYRRGRSTDEGNVYLAVNANGSMAVFTTVPEEEIAAWSLLTTAGAGGKFLDVAVDEAGVIWVTTERTVNNNTTRRTESFAAGTALDAHIAVTSGLPLSALPGGSANHLIAQTVHVVVDGAYRGTAVVNGSGGMTIPGAAAQSRVEIGLDDGAFLIRNMPLKAPLPDGTVLGLNKRIVNATISLNGGSEFAFSANGGPADPVTLTPGFDGKVELNGLLGWTEEGHWEITQPKPMPFQWRGLAVDVSHQR